MRTGFVGLQSLSRNKSTLLDPNGFRRFDDRLFHRDANAKPLRMREGFLPSGNRLYGNQRATLVIWEPACGEGHMAEVLKTPSSDEGVSAHLRLI